MGEAKRNGEADEAARILAAARPEGIQLGLMEGCLVTYLELTMHMLAGFCHQAQRFGDGGKEVAEALASSHEYLGKFKTRWLAEKGRRVVLATPAVSVK